MSSGECPSNWIVCPPCPGVADAVGDAAYTYETVSTAPWYDADSEPTSRFLGVHALGMDGLADSTREATVKEGITDGGTVSRVRHAVRQVRVRALLSALGEDALEAGLAWLKAALDPDTCGTHGNSCGAVDSCFFVACPPARNEVTGPIPIWGTPVTNLFTNPRAVSTGATNQFGAVSAGTASFITDFPGVTPTARRWTGTGTAAARLLCLVMPEILVGDGSPVRMRIRVRASAPFNQVAISTRPTITTTTGQQVLSSTVVGGTIPAGESIIEAWGPQFTGAPAADPGITIIGTPTVIGATFDVTEIYVDRGLDQGVVYFDGTYPDSVVEPLERYEWTGAANASTSTFESGSFTQGPDPIAWEENVDDLLRTMHDVTCISGPLIEQKLHRDDMWGYIVEFTLAAATPWLFGITRPVAIPPSLPVVVQDVPFNLVPYPSAELPGTAVVVARNFVLNPSVEVNATGWVASGFAITAPVGARSTELVSVGDASYKVVSTAASAGSNGWIAASQDVPLTGITPSTRLSFNIWAAGSVESGTAVLGNIEFVAIYYNSTPSQIGAEVILATEPAAGGAMSVKSLVPKAGAVSLSIIARQRITSWSAGAVVRLYVDSAAVTVP